MATKTEGTVLQSWVPRPLAEQVRARAELERRSVSQLFEISLTPAPMNPDAKVLSWMAAAITDELPSHTELRERVKQLDAEQKASEPATKSTAPITVATFDC